MVTSDTRSPRWSGLTLALLAFTQFIVTIDYNIVYVALPDIGRELGFTAQTLQWVVSAYAVALGGLLLFGGRAVDRIGPRRMLVTGLVIYAVSSLTGGLSGDPGLLVAARAVQGVGGALLTPATLMLIFTHFAAGPERNRATSVWGAMGGAGLAAGLAAGRSPHQLARMGVGVLRERPARPDRRLRRPQHPSPPTGPAAVAASTRPARSSPPPAPRSWCSAWSADPTRAGAHSRAQAL